MITVNTREDYLKELAKLLPESSIGAEIGVLYGDFSKLILDIIKPEYLALIDPYKQGGKTYINGLQSAYSTEADYDKVVKRFKQEIEAYQVGIIKKTSSRAANLFTDASLNFFYLDASHLYEDVKKDLNVWLLKLKKNGLACGHDYIDHEDFGVIQAVNNFCNRHDFEFVIFNKNGGDYALRRKA